MTNDHAYYYGRAESELQMARKATSPAAVKAHYMLAGYYLDLVHGGRRDPSPTYLQIQVPQRGG